MSLLYTLAKIRPLLSLNWGFIGPIYVVISLSMWLGVLLHKLLRALYKIVVFIPHFPFLKPFGKICQWILFLGFYALHNMLILSLWWLIGFPKWPILFRVKRHQMLATLLYFPFAKLFGFIGCLDPSPQIPMWNLWAIFGDFYGKSSTPPLITVALIIRKLMVRQKWWIILLALCCVVWWVTNPSNGTWLFCRLNLRITTSPTYLQAKHLLL